MPGWHALQLRRLPVICLRAPDSTVCYKHDVTIKGWPCLASGNNNEACLGLCIRTNSNWTGAGGGAGAVLRGSAAPHGIGEQCMQLWSVR